MYRSYLVELISWTDTHNIITIIYEKILDMLIYRVIMQQILSFLFLLKLEKKWIEKKKKMSSR